MPLYPETSLERLKLDLWCKCLLNDFALSHMSVSATVMLLVEKFGSIESISKTVRGSEEKKSVEHHRFSMK